MPESPFTLKKLIDARLEQLIVESKTYSKLITHNAENGGLNETHLKSFLKEFLPKKMGVHSGFLVSPNGRAIVESRQCDIIIYDALNNAPFYNSEQFGIFPIEMVYAVIEVKTRLTPKEMKTSFESCQIIRDMARRGKYYWQSLPSGSSPATRNVSGFVSYKSTLPPRFYIFSYSGPSKQKTFEKYFVDATTQNNFAHIHGLCCLGSKSGGGWFGYHRPYTQQQDRCKFQFEGGLHNFLNNLIPQLESMIPCAEKSNDEISAVLKCFDPVDRSKYEVILPSYDRYPQDSNGEMDFVEEE